MTDRTSQAQIVVVYDGCPMYRLGLSVTLADAGFSVREADDPDCRGSVLALVTLEGAAAPDCLRRLRSDRPSAIVTALLAEPSLAAFRAAFQAGAVGAVARDGSSQDIIATLSAAAEGRVLVPSDVLGALLAGVGTRSAPPLGRDQEDWLRRMARGDTISEIAVDAGYSERAMYRHLRGLYSRLGARNRTEALVCAVQHGLLVEPVTRWQHPATEPAPL